MQETKTTQTTLFNMTKFTDPQKELREVMGSYLAE